jgi:hypothetical protein
VTKAVFGIVLDGRAEQGVYEGGLSEPTLANDHYREGSTPVAQEKIITLN